MQDLRYTAVLTRVVLQDTTTPTHSVALRVAAVAIACVTMLGILTAGIAHSGKTHAPQAQTQAR